MVQAWAVPLLTSHAVIHGGSNTEMMLDALALELVDSGPGASQDAVSSLIESVPAPGALECVHFELKREFVPGAREWAELSKDIVALANTGGGVIVFGIDDDGTRLGLSESLLSVLDPAKVTDQLRRKAPSASVSTAYLEATHGEALFGLLIVQPLSVPLVFDKEWGYNSASGEHRTVIRPGLLYVRTPGKSAPAHQADVREVWQRSVDLALQRLMARFERVASLPLDSELIVTYEDTPDSGYLLVDKGEGREVQIVSDPATPAVPLREAPTADIPYASVASEVVNQVRHWQQADREHTVSKHTLTRWWLERAQLSLDDTAGEFCLLSAARGRGYPMYWASVIEPARLREILEREFEVGSAIPSWAYAYVVGVFFWNERDKILRRHMDRLSVAPAGAVRKVIEAASYSELLTSLRWKSRLQHSSGLVTMAELQDDSERATKIFSELLEAELDGTITPSEAGFAKQLDLLVHAPI